MPSGGRLGQRGTLATWLLERMSGSSTPGSPGAGTIFTVRPSSATMSPVPGRPKRTLGVAVGRVGRRRERGVGCVAASTSGRRDDRGGDPFQKQLTSVVSLAG